MLKHELFPRTSRSRVLRCLLAISLLIVVCASNARAAEDTPIEEPVSDGWSMIWESRTQELLALQNESEVLRKDLPKTARKLDTDISNAQREFQRLFALMQTSRSMPSELVILDGHMLGLENTLKAALAPVNAVYDTMQTKLKELEDAEKELSLQLPKDRSDLASDFNAYLNNLTQVKKKIASLRGRLATVLEPGKLLLERITTTRTQIEAMLPDLWRRHYLEPSNSLFDITAWTAIIPSFDQFKQNFVTRLLSELPLTLRLWIGCAIRFLFIFLPALAITRLFVRKVSKQHVRSALRWKRIANRALIWIGLGLALHFASWTKGGDVFRAMIVPANIFLIWGQLTLAWELRAIGKPETPKRSPFQPLFLPVVASLILLFFNPPLPVLGPLWIFCLAIAIFAARRRTKPEGTPLLEANVLKLEPIAQWLAVLVTILGWGRLAILVYMGFVALAVSIQLGVALMGLIDEASSRLPKDGASALIGGLLLGLAAPLVLLLVAGALVLWVIAYPGGSYLLRHAVEFNIHVGAVSFDGLRILFILTAFYMTRSLIAVGASFLVGLPDRLSRFDRSMIQPMQTAYTYILWALFGLYGLHALGVSMTNLAVVAGGLSVGIGFGLQTIVNNFISGLILIFGRTLQEGDIVDLGGTLGTVRKVSIRATTVETFDNAVIFVPNADLVSNRLTNWTRNSLTIRRDVLVGVAYGSDIALVQRLLLDVAKQHPRVLHHPSPVVIFNDFGASTLDFILRVWVDDINVGATTASDLRTGIDRAFRENNIEIAFPQMDLHVRSAEGLSGMLSPRPQLAEADKRLAGPDTDAASNKGVATGTPEGSDAATEMASMARPAATPKKA